MDKIYSECKKRLYHLSLKTGECVEEFINEAWLQLVTEEKAVNSDSIYLRARTLILNASAKAHCFISKETSKVCTKCKQELPAACFYIRFHKQLGRQILESRCIGCMKLNSKENSMPSYRRCRESLSDGYIKKCLRSRGINNKRITEAMIVQCRAEILSKRTIRERRKQLGKSNYQDGRDNLADWYVKANLKQQGFKNITEHDLYIGREMIEERRSKRKTKALKKNFQKRDTLQ